MSIMVAMTSTTNQSVSAELTVLKLKALVCKWSGIFLANYNNCKVHTYQYCLLNSFACFLQHIKHLQSGQQIPGGKNPENLSTLNLCLL